MITSPQNLFQGTRERPATFALRPRRFVFWLLRKFSQKTPCKTPAGPLKKILGLAPLL